MTQDTDKVVVEVRPCVDARGNRTSWDICYPPEPDAIGVGVIASCYGSLEQAQAMADALSHPTPTPSEDEGEAWRTIDSAPTDGKKMHAISRDTGKVFEVYANPELDKRLYSHWFRIPDAPACFAPRFRRFGLQSHFAGDAT